MKAPYKKLAIIGLGLIGSSIARAARQAQLAAHIAAADANELSLSFAKKHGFVDSTTLDPAQAAAGADAIVIATPTHLLADICEAIAPHIAPGALVMDTGSVKQLPLDVMQQLLPGHALIIPAHPIAGSEHSGVAAGRADLLDHKRVIITPDQPLTTEDLQLVNKFWQAFGARVEAMPASLHDTIYGYVSHLPQLLAFAAGDVLEATENEREANQTLGRFLRLTGSSGELWTSIFWLNRDVLLTAVNRYLDVLSHIRKELAGTSEPADASDAQAARLVLLPRVAASCLITTVMEAEKKAGIGFIRFAGMGFSDVTAPATTDPEEDMASISSNHKEVLVLLEQLEGELMRYVAALASDTPESLGKLLE